MTTILELFREWENERRAANTTTDDEAVNRHCYRMSALETKMIGIPATTAQELAAKLISFTCFGDYSLSGHPGGERILSEAAEMLGAKYGIEEAIQEAAE